MDFWVCKEKRRMVDPFRIFLKSFPTVEDSQNESPKSLLKKRDVNSFKTKILGHLGGSEA